MTGADEHLASLPSEQAQQVADRDAAIYETRTALFADLQAAANTVGHAHTRLAQLTGDLYDVEYAEGSVGTDVSRHLGDAGRSLRAAMALVIQAGR